VKLRTWLAAALLMAPTPAAIRAATPITIEGKFDTATEHLLIPFDMNGTRFWCNVDTGFSALVAVDRAKAMRAGIVEKPAVPTPDGNAPSGGDGSASVLLTVGTLTFTDQAVIVRNLPAEAPDMDCIVGAALLRDYVIEFDQVTPRLRLHERQGFTPPSGAAAVPLVFRTNPTVPFVRLALTLPDGTRQELQTVVDTGAAYYALAVVPAVTARLRAVMPTAERPVTAHTAGSEVTLVAARPPSIVIGPFTVREPVIALVSSGLGGGIDDGVLGNGFLRRFTMTIDFAGRQMYLLPNERFPASQAFDASGVGFRPTAEGYDVEVVLPDTPAARAGLQRGDRLMTIDSMPAAGLTPVELRDRLSRPGVDCELSLMRAGALMRIVLVLQRRL
jgi:predicted aspartyl protease